MNRLLSTLPLLLLAACHPSPDAVEVQPISLESVPAVFCDTVQRVKALTNEERQVLAKALIATHTWGNWQQHQTLAASFPRNRDDIPLVNKHIVGKLSLPQDASPALRELVAAQLRKENWNWPSFTPLITLVATDYLPEHPEDSQAWQFLSFMMYLSDGEVIYNEGICSKLREVGLDTHPEGQRLLHRNQHWRGCSQTCCEFCR